MAFRFNFQPAPASNAPAFRFNFQISQTQSSEENVQEPSVSDSKAEPSPEQKQHFEVAAGWVYADREMSLVGANEMESLTIGQHTFLKRTLNDPENISTANQKLKQVLAYSDVVSGVYEGGFKLWECALDLIEYLEGLPHLMSGKRVLDLGCGHGLPTIFALQAGAAQVCFQDLNSEVLQYVTMPNTLHNSSVSPSLLSPPTDPTTATVSYVCGDWRDPNLSNLLSSSGSFDLILSSDTIYSSEYIPYLFNLIRKHLNKTGGVALVAAKRYYFGVGGSTSQFLDLVRSHPDMKAEIVKVIQNGVSNLREIISVQYNTVS